MDIKSHDGYFNKWRIPVVCLPIVLGLLTLMIHPPAAVTSHLAFTDMYSAKAAVVRDANSFVLVADITGPVVPVTARFVERVISLAEQKGATACVLQLNTPGGLYTTTQEIVAQILNSRVPVVVFVHPQGGWAGSAGTFITISAHVAAMSPGTRIGAAHPVNVGQPELSEVSGQKITEDAAAWARSIAQMRGRNAQAAELAVRESRSFSDVEALKENLIDLRASNLKNLLAGINGRTVLLASGERRTLQTEGAALMQVEMSFFEKVLHTVSDPNIAYLLMTLGMAGLMVEIYNPGLIFPGVVGAISLLLGLYSLGTLDAYAGGILFIILAFGFFIAEAFVPSHGALGTGGVVSFVVGSIMLFSNNPAGLKIRVSLIVTTSAFIAALLFLLVMAVVKGQKMPVATGKETLIGAVAVARTELNPRGTVFIAGENWNALSEEGRVEAGEEVVVTGIEGLMLKVKRKE
ncbi:NfeD family protein [Syntrophothermus lipocalidus]|uniref:Uncharacterized protein n=1 Tax=Syntrophothermus lipocalidus (strain DSM 12680 / TGB-C1) TaxID=643648 RepID=D7CJ98_SYNLT|nr:nodulation protein NfeD [Syntrophothermus lipocalidus]ADI00987.1 protein of unknown function DUF107 [Syntrophothermus lipocalidus DSM 12680]